MPTKCCVKLLLRVLCLLRHMLLLLLVRRLRRHWLLHKTRLRQLHRHWLLLARRLLQHWLLRALWLLSQRLLLGKVTPKSSKSFVV
jgi:hypothetical protein